MSRRRATAVGFGAVLLWATLALLTVAAGLITGGALIAARSGRR